MTQPEYAVLEDAAGLARAVRIVGRTLLYLLAVGVACAMPTELPAPELTLTPNPNMIVGIGSHGSTDEAAIMQRLGVQHVRVSYYMKQDSYAERQMFALRLVDLQLHDLTPLVVIPDADPRNVTPIISFARQMRATIQVGNEFDAQGFTGTAYAKLMRAITDSVSASQFVGMGLASTDGQPWGKTPDTVRQAQFLREYLAANGPLLSAWAIHCYGPKLGDAIRARVLATQAVLQHRMPLFITETGIDSAWITRADPLMSEALIDHIQATESTDAINAARSLGVAGLFFYQLFTADEHHRPENYGYGFLRADATTTRPVFDAVREAIGGAR